MADDRELLRQCAERWERAGRELDALRRREIESVDTQAAIRQIFGSGEPFDPGPRRTTLGLVEQQVWFARLRAVKRPQ